ncbi:endolytic transglycosylase MltG [Streptomyces sp. ME19-01-6]|uniref:endolytic transglycosylase MltG n=1 Tax=Streptomyces sp. ME19-01-6 TaxID=3028686 RepID=UPI0029A9B418|nr:endolytic transglycosylase MltG [Streptomyces sp. ME19-01-6]MDX3228617.1 endolytic transglycosylase MltG [Streptomyces sp. ME19-01-6]
MTDYGRGTGSQPWDPQDPLYGDQGWGGHQTATGHDPYAQEAYAQDPYAQQGSHGHGGYSQDPYAQDTYAQDPYGQDTYGQGGHQQEQYSQQGYGNDGYGHEGYGQDPYAQDPYAQDPYAHQQYPQGYPQDTQQPQQHQQQPHWDGHDTGGYPQQPHHPQQPQQPYGNGDWDGSQAPQPQEPVAEQAKHDEPDDDHPFFRDGDGGGDILRDDRADRGRADDEYDDEEDADDDEGRGRRNKPPKRRSGVACLFVTVVLVGVVGGGGYFAYQFWQSRFGPAPDYSGAGSGEAQVEIPEGTGTAEIGSILVDKGVVKSSGAFVEAVKDSGKFVQPGSYTLRKHMSAAAAVKLMVDPASSNGLIVTEGMRNAQIYAAIDKKIGLKAGTTKNVAMKEAKNLGLPDWADDNPKIKDPLEGFLYPSRYSVGKDAKPEDVLRNMVAQAKKSYANYDLEGKSKDLGLKSPLELVTVASLVQAEGVTHDDFRKMAEVVYNRLEPGNTETNGKLEFDSTYNYIKNQNKIDISLQEIKNYDNPYNTYFYRGLTPGPIGNPGEDALKAAMNPTDDGWYYFISLDGKTTKFTKTYAEHRKLADQLDKQLDEQRKNG